MKIKFKTKIEKQITASELWIDNITEQILYGGAKGGGKSYLGASLIFGDALIYPDTHYFIAREELIDLRKYIVPTIHEVFNNWKLKIGDYAKLDGQYNVYHLYNKSQVYLIACKELPSDPMYERFGSMQMTRGWIEEGGEVSEAAKANLWLSIGRWKNDIYKLKKKLLITANPKRGWMKREFVDLLNQGVLPASKKYIQAFATDNLYLSEDYRKTLSEEKDTVRRQRLWEGKWDYDEDQDSLINFDWLCDAFSNTITKDGQKYLIVDVARLGKDSTVFSFWDGLDLYRIEKFQKQDTERTKQQAKDYASSELIPWSNILIDEDGIGGAVVDGMFGVRGFIANSTPLPTQGQIRGKAHRIESDLTPRTNFGNLKAQCAYKVAELINEHKIRFSVADYREEIIEDVNAILRAKEIDSDKRLQIKSKEFIKANLGRSPDVGDTILMRAWFELKTDTELEPEPEITGDDIQAKWQLERRRTAYEKETNR
uniref:Putative terminase n=1 Tax=viral metagenome TaxID=1070528 RepID=A0A6H1ZQR9_9ZZZZ